MSDKKRLPIRVLIADDEAEVRDAYRQILLESDMSGETAVFHNLRARLFSGNAPDQAVDPIVRQARVVQALSKLRQVIRITRHGDSHYRILEFTVYLRLHVLL